MILRLVTILLSLAVSLSIVPSLNAGPIDWTKHHKRFLLMEGAAVTGAIIHYKGLRHCQRFNGVEPCDEHYGSAWAMYGVTTAFTAIALPATAEGCWKDNDSARFCYLFAYGGSAFQTSWGIHEWTIGRGRERDHDFRPRH